VIINYQNFELGRMFLGGGGVEYTEMEVKAKSGCGDGDEVTNKCFPPPIM